MRIRILLFTLMWIRIQLLKKAKNGENIWGKTEDLIRLTEDSSGESLEEGENGGAEVALL